MKAKEKALFFHQFAALLNAMSVQQSLNLAGNDRHPAFKHYLQKVSAAVDSGQDLASAMAVDRRYFDGWTLSLIKLAEYSGSLCETFRRLAIACEQQQRRERLYRSVRIAAIVIIWSLLLLIVAIFKQQPSGFFKLAFWLHALGLGLLLIGISIFISRYPGRILPQMAAKLPGLGKVMQARSLLHFAELALPLSCGVPMLTALELVRDRIPDPTMAANLAIATRQVRTGQTLSRSLQGKLAPIALQMIRTGEETGNLDAALQKMAEYYEGELERSLAQLQGVLRPMSILAIAGLVAVLGIRGITFLMNSLPG